MVVGYDAWHDTSENNSSTGAVVCSINQTQTKFHSTGIVLRDTNELCTRIKPSLANALDAYKRINGSYPKGVVFYRDGVGEGDIKKILDVRSNFGDC